MISDIHHAFARRDAAAIRELLTRHPALREAINDPIFPFNSPAIVAYADDAAMVAVLLEMGADPNRRSQWWAGGFHPLHSATGKAAELLLAAGAVPDACALAQLDQVDAMREMLAIAPACVHERGGDGQRPLHFARSTAMLDLLLDAGAAIDARDLDHRATAAEWMLERKAGAGRYALARHLVARGASTDIFLATALGLTERVRELLTADPALLDARTGAEAYGEQPPSSYHIYFWTIGGSCSPMDVALQFGHAELLDTMVTFATPRQRLLFACRRGDEVTARRIVRDEPGVVASLATDDHRAVADAAWASDAGAVALMLSLGFDPRTPGHDGGTALHCAAWAGSAECAALLLGSPVAPELLTSRDAVHGATALGWCGHGSVHGDRSRAHVEVARLLVAAGAVVESGIEASEGVRGVLERGGQGG